MPRRTCRRCKGPLTGYGNVCDRCIYEPMDADRKGQKLLMKAVEREQEMAEEFAYIDKLFGLEPQEEPPTAAIQLWAKKRCVTRKTCDDWGGLAALHRDFLVQGNRCGLAAFRVGVERSGFAVDGGLVWKLVLKGDVELWKS